MKSKPNPIITKDRYEIAKSEMTYCSPILNDEGLVIAWREHKTQEEMKLAYKKLKKDRWGH